MICGWTLRYTERATCRVADEVKLSNVGLASRHSRAGTVVADADLSEKGQSASFPLPE